MGKISLVFPGQGSQYVGMGSNLCDEYPEARQTFEEANDVLGFDVKKMCFEGGMTYLGRTENAQPAILTVSVAVFRVYMKKFNLNPGCAAGHSLGEISALTCAGAVNFADALRIVRKRGIFMREAIAETKGAMVALSGIDAEIIKEYCQTMSSNNHQAVISNYNAPSQIVISGHKDTVFHVGEELEKKGAKMKVLKTDVPFHSPLMKTAAQKFKAELKKYKYNPIEWDVVSNVTALPYAGANKIVENLCTQMTAPVKWHRTMCYFKERGIAVVLEIGPNTVLKNIMKKNTLGISAYSFDVKEDVESFAKDWYGNFSRFIDRTLTAAVACPNYNWDDRQYRQGVIEPYRKIKQMAIDLEREGEFPGMNQLKEAMGMLKSVLMTKKIPPNEQEEIIREIICDTKTESLFINSG